MPSRVGGLNKIRKDGGGVSTRRCQKIRFRKVNETRRSSQSSARSAQTCRSPRKEDQKEDKKEANDPKKRDQAGPHPGHYSTEKHIYRPEVTTGSNGRRAKEKCAEAASANRGQWDACCDMFKPRPAKTGARGDRGLSKKKKTKVCKR